MFLYLPCQEIFKRGVNQPFTDLDVVLISNGKFIVGEVKSDPGGFAQADLEKLLEVAKRSDQTRSYCQHLEKSGLLMY